MDRARLPILFSLLTVLLLLAWAASSLAPEPEPTLRFSNTQEWDPAIYAKRNGAPPLVGERAFSIPLPPPPENGSEETMQELAYLHELETERTEEELAEIHEELLLEDARFGAFRYAELRAMKPATVRLIDAAMPEFTAALIQHKEDFDRVRPNFLDPSLSPAIAVPGHPAYPSGHAGQSMVVALILSALDPVNAAAYENSALRIAHNREIAGVHYPSDSEVGRELARAYVALLTETPRYEELFALATEEWKY